MSKRVPVPGEKMCPLGCRQFFRPGSYRIHLRSAIVVPGGRKVCPGSEEYKQLRKEQRCRQLKS